jgi:hypothetical protein
MVANFDWGQLLFGSVISIKVGFTSTCSASNDLLPSQERVYRRKSQKPKQPFPLYRECVKLILAMKSYICDHVLVKLVSMIHRYGN